MALGQETDAPTARVQEAVGEVVAGLDFSPLEGMELPGFSRRMSVKDAVLALASGETISAEDALAGVLGAFGEALHGLGATMLSLMLPVLLTSILLHRSAQRRTRCPHCRAASASC